MQPRHLAWSVVVVVACLAAPGCVVEERRPRRISFLDDEARSRRPETPAPLWRHADEIASLTVVRKRQKSSHFVGSPDVEIRVNARAAAYGQRGGELGEGALIVATHELPDRPGVVRFAMEKRAGDATNRACQPSERGTSTGEVRAGARPTEERSPDCGGNSPAPRWEYAVIDETSHVLEQGRIATCVRCHEEAPRDEVFGPPGL